MKFDMKELSFEDEYENTLKVLSKLKKILEKEAFPDDRKQLSEQEQKIQNVLDKSDFEKKLYFVNYADSYIEKRIANLKKLDTIQVERANNLTKYFNKLTSGIAFIDKITEDNSDNYLLISGIVIYKDKNQELIDILKNKNDKNLIIPDTVEDWIL